jgi:hypothetical protein
LIPKVYFETAKKIKEYQCNFEKELEKKGKCKFPVKMILQILHVKSISGLV